MSDLKKFYSKIVKASFPDRIRIEFGKDTLTYTKRVWDMEGECSTLR